MAEIMFSIDDREVKAFTKKLKRITEDALPRAITAIVNMAAKGTHARALKNIKKDFTLRNQYTEKSLMIWQSKYKPGRAIGRINAQAGSKSPYLPLQETGGVVRAKRRRIPVPTIFSRGGSRRNVIQKEFKLRAMGQIAGFKQQYTKKGRKKEEKAFSSYRGKADISLVSLSGEAD